MKNTIFQSSFKIYFIIILVISSCVISVDPVPVLTTYPCVEWRNFSWLDTEYYYPTTNVTQINSDYDWWYDHCTAYTNPSTQTGILGYIACGVSKYRADRNLNNSPIAYDERYLGGCTYGVAPLYVEDCSEYDFGNHENCYSGKLGLGFNTIGRVNDNGITDYLFTMNYDGEYLRVKQLKDGTFLTIGHSKSTMKRPQSPQNGTPLFYNPTIGNPNSYFKYNEIFSNLDHKNISHWDVMKFDLNGVCLFNNIYGQEDFGSIPNYNWDTHSNLTGNQISYLSGGVAYDFVQKSSGNTISDNIITIVGSQAKHITGIGPVGKACLIQIQDDGLLVNKMFLDLSNDNSQSVVRAIALVESPTPYYLVAISKHSGNRTITGLYAISYNLSNSILITEFGTSYFPNDSKAGSTVWNMVVQNGFVYLPVIEKCNNVWWAGNNTGELFVYKASIPNSMPNNSFQSNITSKKLTDIHAFDLKARICNMSNGNLAVVSTVRKKRWLDINVPSPVVPPYILGCSIGPGSYCTMGSSNTESTEYWNTDAYLTEIKSNTLNSIWTKVFHSEDTPPNLTNSSNGFRSENYGGDDPKHQECLYGISEGPNNTIIVSGNSSGNVDDNYMVKIKKCSYIQE